jgi:hypothetical protein
MSEHDNLPRRPTTARENIAGTEAPQLNWLEERRPRFSNVVTPAVKRIIRIVNGLKQLAKYTAVQRAHLDNNRVKAIARQYPGPANEHQEHRSRNIVMPVRSSDLVYQVPNGSEKSRLERITQGTPGARAGSGERGSASAPTAMASAIVDVAKRAMLHVKRELAASCAVGRRIGRSRFARQKVQRANDKMRRPKMAAWRLNVEKTRDQRGTSTGTSLGANASAVPFEWRRMGAEFARMRSGLGNGPPLILTRREGPARTQNSTGPRWADLISAQRALISAIGSPTQHLSGPHRNSAGSSPREEHRAFSPDGGRYGNIARGDRIAAPRAGAGRFGESADNAIIPRRRTGGPGLRVHGAAVVNSHFAIAPTEPDRTLRIAPANQRGVVVNYSPTVVINGAGESPELDRRVVEVISRHGHELAQIIERQLALRQRSIF